jgi:fructose-bisphosphate aldolase, class II
MTLASPKQLLENQNVVLGLNVIGLEHAEAYVAAAEQAGQGLILQLSENAVKYRGALGPIGSALLVIAEQSKQPVSVMLDHATDPHLAEQAIAIGFTAVMFDASKLSHDKNVLETKRIVELAKASNVFVEAELGEIGGKDGVHAPGVRTSPQDAKGFVDQTGVDALAVAVGSSHAMTEKTATLDFDLIAKLASSVSVPLVLHGSSGVALDDLKKAASAGIRKVNIGTEFNSVFSDAIRNHMQKKPEVTDPRKYLGEGRQQMTAKAVEYLELFK